MSAYVIVDIEITDPAGYEEYKKAAAPTVAAHGGSYVARGGTTEVLEGTWKPGRLVILRFENIQKAKEWLNSAEYKGPRAQRHKAARTNMIVTEGL
jgi:uncharacterized protein (DUF1330 family)